PQRRGADAPPGERRAARFALGLRSGLGDHRHPSGGRRTGRHRLLGRPGLRSRARLREAALDLRGRDAELPARPAARHLCLSRGLGRERVRRLRPADCARPRKRSAAVGASRGRSGEELRVLLGAAARPWRQGLRRRLFGERDADARAGRLSRCRHGKAAMDVLHRSRPGLGRCPDRPAVARPPLGKALHRDREPLSCSLGKPRAQLERDRARRRNRNLAMERSGSPSRRPEPRLELRADAPPRPARKTAPRGRRQRRHPGGGSGGGAAAPARQAHPRRAALRERPAWPPPRALPRPAAPPSRPGWSSSAPGPGSSFRERSSSPSLSPPRRLHRVTAPTRKSLAAGVLALLRPPNVFTAVADSFAGLVLARQAGPVSGHPRLWCIAASPCLYLGGMALNDYLDREVDAVERPQRPIPSGTVPPAVAAGLGAALLAAGIALAGRA